MNLLTPAEISEYTISVGVKKSTLPITKMFALAFLAGAFIALAAQGGNLSSHTIDSDGLTRLVAAIFFPVGLMLVVNCGAELFTGNTLIILSCLEKKSKWSNYGKNLLCVYLGNFVGALFVTFLISASGQWNYSSGGLGAYTIKIAAAKVDYTFSQAFVSGILCNWLVCLAVWTSYAAKDIGGKVWGVYFPIALFVLAGFEHSIANMYYIPAGLIAMTNPEYLRQAVELQKVSQASLANLSVGGLFTRNLIPVTLGNIVGGVGFVGLIYYFIYRYKVKQA